MTKHVAILLIAILMAAFSGAQESYAYEDFMQQVVKHHPLTKQSDLVVELGEADLRLQRAVTDPYVKMNYGDKGYDGKDYYEKSEFKFALPTALGMEIFAGYESATGALVDPEISSSNTGVYKAGVTMPLGTKLLLNERTLAIRQGKLMVEMAEQERRIILNDLLYRANLAYLNWALAYELLQVQENALDVADDQFSFIKEVFLAGDRPAIDTVEAFLQVQNRTFRRLKAERDLNAAKLIVETFLWDEEGNALALRDDLSPEQLLDQIDRLRVVEDSVLQWKQQLIDLHPDLNIKVLEINALKLEQQNAISDILPQLELNYAALTPGVSERDINSIGLNDRMVGVGFKYPLLLRKQRSKLSMVNIKSLQKRLDLDLKQVELDNKLDQAVFDYNIASEQTQLYGRMTQNYSALLEAEKTKFSIGESSVFLLNSRENKLFEAQEKLLETRSKTAVSALKVIQTANREEMYIRLLN